MKSQTCPPPVPAGERAGESRESAAGQRPGKYTSEASSSPTFERVREAARGRWDVILPALGIDAAFLRNRHGPCPGCGGTDRFRYDDKDGTGSFICGGGGDPTAGDGFALLQHVHGWTPSEALKQAAAIVGIERGKVAPTRPTPRPASKQDVGKRDYGRTLWAMAQDQAEPWANVTRLDTTVAAHSYCRRKSINRAFGAARLNERGRDLLVVPIKTHGTGELLAVQTIDPDGGKLTYGRMDDAGGTPGYLLLGDERDTHHTWVVVEGWATAWAVAGSLHRLRRPAPVLVAFGSSRMEKVAEGARTHYGARVKVLPEGELWT